jgi:hypothetical protein
MIRVGSPEDHGLALAAIQIDGGTQSRANVNDQVVSEYAEAIKAGATFPPIVVFYDGKKHWLADGFHRFHAYQKIGREKVAADVRQGTRRDAILHSVGANETHGLRRTRDDKRRAVLTLLNDQEWSKWSDGEIAKRCAVSREYVNRLRPKDTCDQVTGMERTFVHPKTGEPTTMKMTVGKTDSQKNAREALVNDEPSPEVGPQAEASHVGTDTGTPADREGRHEGEAASVGLPTISDAGPNEIIPCRSIFKELVALWKIAGEGDRKDFKAFIRGSEAAARLNPPSTAPTVEPEATPSPPPASGTHSNPQPVSLTTADKAGEVEPPPSALLVAISKPFVLRPHCLNPDLCAGSGANHCHACKKAMAEGEAA